MTCFFCKGKNGEVAARIEEIVAGFEKALTEIAVVNYSAA